MSVLLRTVSLIEYCQMVSLQLRELWDDILNWVSSHIIFLTQRRKE